MFLFYERDDECLDTSKALSDIHVFFSRKWPALAAKSQTRQKIIHNSVKTYDILMK